ncbi:MAG TPA: sulfatase-like hydrolase/transferase [Acidobacteriaceae bacterium]|nr:sulfatase-like hydrolase/transferase [Acidobacteriaceae bacterium]
MPASVSARPHARPPARTPWPRCWLEGAGAAILLSPGLLWSQLSQTHIDAFHRLLPLNTVARALAVDLLLLSIAATLVVRGMEAISAPPAGTSKPGRRSILLLWALWFGLLAARCVAGMIVAQVLWWRQITTGRAFLLTAGVLLILWLASTRGYAWTIRALRFAVLLTGFSILWMIPALIVAGLAHQPYDQAQLRKPLPPATSSHRRVVWLLFDEMSYDQVFVHRWPGLDLPNLDKLRGQSVTFTGVQPDGFFTEDVIPSLFLGKPIEDVRGTPGGWMIFQPAQHAPWQRFDGSQTLFADAQRAGWTTGAIGEYNPYCRILKDQLDFCWMDMPPLPDHLSRDNSTLANVVAPLAADWQRVFRKHRPHPPGPKAPTSVDDLAAVHAGSNLIADDAIDLCFVHLPLPHPPGNYDRKTGRIGPGGSYIDNLALSDKALGALLAAIAATGNAGQTTVIVSSDHSWRTRLWRNNFGWTQEDEAASRHGHFDPRPMLMVKFPGETTAQAVDRPVPLLSMHALVEAMIAGRIDNAQQLETWAAQQ